MNRPFLALSIVFLALVGALGARADDGPAVTPTKVFEKSRPGDWVALVGTLHACMAPPRGISLTYRIDSGTDTDVSVVASASSSAMREWAQHFPRSQAPRVLALIAPGNGASFSSDSADELVEIGGKQFACTKVSLSTTIEGGTTRYRAWFCPDMPGPGLVRLECSYSNPNVSDADSDWELELVGYGNEEQVAWGRAP